MRAVLWTAVAWTLCVAGAAVAEEKTEPARAAEAQVAPQAGSPATEEASATANEATPAEPSAEAAASKPEEAAPEAKPAEAAPAPAEPARAEKAEPEKAPAARAAHRAPFQGSWLEASADEKALFLEAFGESSRAVQERWDKATPDERKKILRAHPLLGARTMKHRWATATPEERAAFLEATPRMVQKIKEAWENATPEQRKLLALEHPYFARKALHHAWTQATPQEKVAFLVASPPLYGELKARWAGATAWQKQWFVKNYPGMESLATSKAWAETSTEERALFLEANPVVAEKARDAWQKMQPEMRATVARKWQGWPLKPYQAQLESAGKTLISVKTRPASMSKGTGKPATRHP